ncbi:hypothetical protein [Streptomyces chrestomyceticus]|uniref:hypothetical protein n=1 Tax=Streptomyces chrestomyceticus TaxID=68185 RepID=UPI0033D2DA5C
MIHHLADSAVQLAAFNPFDGVSPSFGPFDPLLKSKIGIFLGAVWAGGLCFAAYHLMIALAGIARARKGYGDDLDDSKKALLFASVAIVALAAAAVIYGVLASLK